MTGEEGESIRIQLTRIEGGVALLNERLSAAREDIRDIRDIQQVHANRITTLEADRNTRDGERKGLAHGGRALWAIIGLVISAIGAGLLRHFGV